MKSGRRLPIFLATTAVMVCLLGVVSARQTGLEQGSQMTEAVFSDIQILKGMPVDTFFDVMGMFASSMGEDCTYCHSDEAVFRHEAFADPTPRIQRARQMIVMMNALNATYFGGEPRVSCFTCHGGNTAPVNAPRLSLQYGLPDDNPNVMDFPLNPRGSVDEILDRYLDALGGTEQLAAVSSIVAKGTYAGFDTGFGEVPVEIFAVAPNQRTEIVDTIDGVSYRVFDGVNGWWAGPDSPVPIETLTSGNLDRYRLEALTLFPAGIKQAFSEWKVGRTAIDDRPAQIVQGTNPDSGLLPVNLYFDNMSGLLVRLVRWNQTAVGPVPTEINYDDYREVGGVRMPFTWTVSKTYMQHTVTLSEVEPNVPVDASRFATPPAGTPKP